MMNTLVASVGKSPAVVTAALDLLAEQGTTIERLILIYPADNRNIRDGRDLIAWECVNHAPYSVINIVDARVEGCEDVNTAALSQQFLQIALEQLLAYQKDVIHLLVAGGRKNMGALLLGAAQLCTVAGVYHVLDSREREGRHPEFLTIDELYDLSDKERHEYMHPQHARLVPLPSLSIAPWRDELRVFLGQEQADIANLSPQMTQIVRGSWLWDEEQGELTAAGKQLKQIFHPTSFIPPRSQLPLEERLRNIEFGKGHFSEEIAYLRPVCERIIREVPFINGMRSIKGVGGKRSRVEPVRWDEVNKHWVIPVTIYEHEIPTQFFCDTTACMEAEAEYIETELRRVVEKKVTHRQSGSATNHVLIASLGARAAVVTEATRYLREQEEINITDVAVIYPAKCSAIRNNAGRLLEDHLPDEGVKYDRVGIKDLSDVDNKQEVQLFLERVMEKAQEYRDKDYTLHFLLSGGRKAMSAMMFLAAQLSGAGDHVYHIMINDAELEEELDQQGDFETLDEISPADQKEILFPPMEKLSLARLPALSPDPGQIEDETLRGYALMFRK